VIAGCGGTIVEKEKHGEGSRLVSLLFCIVIHSFLGAEKKEEIEGRSIRPEYFAGDQELGGSFEENQNSTGQPS